MRIKIKSVLLFLGILLVIAASYVVFVEHSIEKQIRDLGPDAGVSDYVPGLSTRSIVHFRIDSRFSQEEIVSIREAMKDWESESQGLVKLEGVVVDVQFSEMFTWRIDGVPTIYDASSFSHWPAHVMVVLGNHHSHLGMTMIYTGDVFILNKHAPLFKTIIIHEIGHVIIGDYHSDNPKDVMYPTLGLENLVITKNDIEALRKALEEKL